MSASRPHSNVISFTSHYRATSSSTIDASFELLEPIAEDEAAEEETSSVRHPSSQNSHRSIKTPSSAEHAHGPNLDVSASSATSVKDDGEDEETDRLACRTQSRSSVPGSALHALLEIVPPTKDHAVVPPVEFKQPPTGPTFLDDVPPTKNVAVSPPTPTEEIPTKHYPDSRLDFPSVDQEPSSDGPEAGAKPTNPGQPSRTKLRLKPTNPRSRAPSTAPISSVGEPTYDAILSAMKKSAEAARVAAEKEGKIAEEAAKKAKKAALDAKEALVQAAQKEGEKALAAVEKAKTTAEQAVAREVAEQQRAEDAARAEIARLHAESAKLKAAARAAEAVSLSQAVGDYEARLSKAQRRLDAQRRAKENKARRQAEKRQYKVSMTRRKASAKAAAVLAIAVDEACEKRMAIERAAWKERSKIQESARTQRLKMEREVQSRAGKVGKELMTDWKREKASVALERKRRVQGLDRQRKMEELTQEPLFRRRNAVAAGHKDGIRLDAVAYDAGRAAWKNWLRMKVSLPSLKA